MQAWEERYYDMQDARAEGRSEVIRALIETCMDFNVSKEDTKERIKAKLQIDETAALDYLNLYWKEQA